MSLISDLQKSPRHNLTQIAKLISMFTQNRCYKGPIGTRT